MSILKLASLTVAALSTAALPLDLDAQVAVLRTPTSDAAILADTVPEVTLSVDGMVCPFCAYGLEKRLKEIDSVARVVIRVSDGIVQLWMKDEKKLADEDLKSAVKKAGFKLTEIRRVKPG